MPLFLTSDWHIGESSAPHTHSFLRPYATDMMVEEWLAQCAVLIKPGDTLIFLGDVGISLNDLATLRRLPVCHRVLILGDKEYANKGFTKDEFLARNGELGIFHEVHENREYVIGDRIYFLSHKPTDCLKQDHPAICGHVHGVWRTQQMPNGQPIINVGIDAWGGLVTEAHIEHQYNAVTKGYYDSNCFPRSWS